MSSGGKGCYSGLEVLFVFGLSPYIIYTICKKFQVVIVVVLYNKLAYSKTWIIPIAYIEDPRVLRVIPGSGRVLLEIRNRPAPKNG